MEALLILLATVVGIPLACAAIAWVGLWTLVPILYHIQVWRERRR